MQFNIIMYSCFSVVIFIQKGVAVSQGIKTEDTITLNVQWLNKDGWMNKSGSVGHSVHTSSWCAPKADVHSQQRFFYMGHKGEVTVDQVIFTFHSFSLSL